MYSCVIDRLEIGNRRADAPIQYPRFREPIAREDKGGRDSTGTSIDTERDRAQRRRGPRTPLISYNCHASPHVCVRRSDIARPDTRNTPFCTPGVGSVTRAMLNDSYRFNG